MVLMYLTVEAKWSTGKVQLHGRLVIQLARGRRRPTRVTAALAIDFTLSDSQQG